MTSEARRIAEWLRGFAPTDPTFSEVADWVLAAEQENERLRAGLYEIVTRYGNESNLRAWVPAKVALDLLATALQQEREG